jgi:hypothetical protein
MANCVCKKMTILALACLVAPALAWAKQPQDFEATMEVYRNGKLMGESTISMTTQGDQWTMRSHTRGTKGIARIVGLDEQSWSKGDWDNGSARSLSFERNVKAIKKMHWNAQFDWDAGTVSSVYPDGEFTMELKKNTVDETTVGLRIRMGLARGREEWNLNVLDEEKIEVQTFRAAPVEKIQTKLGCLTVHRVDKIRGETSKRYTRQYYAEELGFAPVFIEHGKTGSDHMETKIVSLFLDGKKIEPLPDC